jgi:hypothetical protein
MRHSGGSCSAIAVPPIEHVGNSRSQHAESDYQKQDEKQGIATRGIQEYETQAEDTSHGQGSPVQRRDPVTDDLDDKHPEADEQKPGEPRQDVPIVSGGEEQPQRELGRK